MKKSIKRLPKCTQNELTVLLELILKYVPTCAKVILYGSYARGNYVIFDKTVTNDGITEVYQSDLDILIIMPTKDYSRAEREVSSHVIPKYNDFMESTRKRHAPASIIVEPIKRVNQNLKISQFFFTDIIKEGVLLYDTGKTEFVKPKALTPQEIYDTSQGYYDREFPLAEDFLLGTKFYNDNEKYVPGSFLLHQSCERYLKVIELVHTHYKPKEHDLEKLIYSLYKYNNELRTVFSMEKNTLENDCFLLLRAAYVDARYSNDFTVTKEQIDYLISRVKLLSDVTIRECERHLKFLKGQIK